MKGNVGESRTIHTKINQSTDPIADPTPLSLQVSDDGMAGDAGRKHDTLHSRKVSAVERGLEHELRAVDKDGLALAVPVQTLYNVTLDLGEVHGHLQRANDTAVTVDETVLDVAESVEHKHAALVPRAGLEPHSFVCL